jgi:hypothetical protein
MAYSSTDGINTGIHCSKVNHTEGIEGGRTNSSLDVTSKSQATLLAGSVEVSIKDALVDDGKLLG